MIFSTNFINLTKIFKNTKMTSPVANTAASNSIAGKKKLNREDFMFKDKTGEELIKMPGQVNGLDFQIRNLTDCTVYLLDTTAQVCLIPILPCIFLEESLS